MPKITIFRIFTFFFYSSDLEEREHVHVMKSKSGYGDYAKFWLSPAVDVVEKGDFTEKENREIVKLIEKNRGLLLQQIERFRNDQHSKIINLD